MDILDITRRSVPHSQSSVLSLYVFFYSENEFSDEFDDGK